MIEEQINNALKNLRAKMPKGYRSILAKEHNVSEAYIDMIFRGTRENLAVIESAAQLAEEHKKHLHSLLSTINDISLNIVVVFSVEEIGSNIIQTLL